MGRSNYEIDYLDIKFSKLGKKTFETDLTKCGSGAF